MFSSFSKSFRGDPQRSFYVKGNNKKRNTDLLKFEKNNQNKPLILAAEKVSIFKICWRLSINLFHGLHGTDVIHLLCCRLIWSVLFTSVVYAFPHIYVSFHIMSCNSPILISNSPTVYSFYLLLEVTMGYCCKSAQIKIFMVPQICQHFTLPAALLLPSSF